MLTDEITASLAPFFNQIGPSHDDLDRLFKRSGLLNADPKRGAPGPVGKMKRVRGVLYWASDNDPEAGASLVKALVDAVRAVGGFRPGNENYPGDEYVAALHDAFLRVGYELLPTGVLQARSLEGLDGQDLTEALWSYVHRARSGAEDPALVIGTAKDLTEATARHVLVQVTGSYPGSNFQATLWQAFDRVGMTTPPLDGLEMLTGDEWQAVEKALFVLACAVNRFRNAAGTGHGRPHPSLASGVQARVASAAAAVVSELLLEALR